MAEKGLNLFDECAAKYAHSSPWQNSAPLFPEGTGKCTHGAP